MYMYTKCPWTSPLKLFGDWSVLFALMTSQLQTDRH